MSVASLSSTSYLTAEQLSDLLKVVQRCRDVTPIWSQELESGVQNLLATYPSLPSRELSVLIDKFETELEAEMPHFEIRERLTSAIKRVFSVAEIREDLFFKPNWLVVWKPFAEEEYGKLPQNMKTVSLTDVEREIFHIRHRILLRTMGH